MDKYEQLNFDDKLLPPNEYIIIERAAVLKKEQELGSDIAAVRKTFEEMGYDWKQYTPLIFELAERLKNKPKEDRIQKIKDSRPDLY